MIRNIVRGMFAASLLCMGLSVQAGEADLILVNGKIVTVDDQFRIEQAVAIKGSRIVAVGKNAELGIRNVLFVPKYHCLQHYLCQ